MASQAPASDPGKTAASPAPAPPAPAGGDGPAGRDGRAGGPGRAGGRGRLRASIDTVGETAELFASSRPGLTIFAVLVLKALIALFGGAGAGWLRVLDAAGTVALVGALGYLLVRMVNRLQHRFLWRVRRKLVLSFVLIGFVPILLSVVFFLMSGVLLLTTVSSSLVQLSFSDVMEDANDLAAMTAVDLGGLVEPAEVRAVLAGRVQAVEERYPDASIAVLWNQAGRDRAAGAGPWRHASRDLRFPAWLGAPPDTGGLGDVSDGGGLAEAPDGSPRDAGGPVDAPDRPSPDAGGLVVTRGRAGWTVVARGVERFDEDGPVYAVVADLPIAGEVTRRMQAARGVTFTHFSVTPTVGGAGFGSAGADASPAAAAFEALRFPFGAPPPDGAPALDLPYEYEARVDLLDWSTGRRGHGAVGFRVHPMVFYREVVEGGEYAVDVFVLGLLVLGVMFLTIEAAAMVMGFALAGSITGAVDELFTGTERVRAGDFAHRIRVETEDQLGELAESFNTMTGSVSDLLTQAEEKRRLEEELRIARDIQMSLLPEGPASVPGLAVAAACRPAREVGGDYFDFIRLDEHRLGVLVADVSGKGTSAAFYMAELKGVVLSLSRFHQSPRELLIEVNRILSATLDGRTFITMTYAVVDLAARRLTYARAGHTPLIHVPSAADGSRTTQVLAPDGLIVGLQIDGVEAKFAELLEESAFPIETGDLVALFTDGVTEAMNEESDLFGEDRLSRTLTERIHLAPDDLKQRILGDVEAFAGAAEQHDDMTIVLLRVGDPPPLPPPASRP